MWVKEKHLLWGDGYSDAVHLAHSNFAVVARFSYFFAWGEKSRSIKKERIMENVGIK